PRGGEGAGRRRGPLRRAGRERGGGGGGRADGGSERVARIQAPARARARGARGRRGRGPGARGRSRAPRGRAPRGGDVCEHVAARRTHRLEAEMSHERDRDLREEWADHPQSAFLGAGADIFSMRAGKGPESPEERQAREGTPPEAEGPS